MSCSELKKTPNFGWSKKKTENLTDCTIFLKLVIKNIFLLFLYYFKIETNKSTDFSLVLDWGKYLSHPSPNDPTCSDNATSERITNNYGQGLRKMHSALKCSVNSGRNNNKYY